MSDSPDVDVLGMAIVGDLGDSPLRWYAPKAYPALGLCVLDSIYSTGNQYGAVLNMIKNYTDARATENADARANGPQDLTDTGRRWGGVDGFAESTGSQDLGKVLRWGCDLRFHMGGHDLPQNSPRGVVERRDRRTGPDGVMMAICPLGLIDHSP